jgi:hypothetical protein
VARKLMILGLVAVVGLLTSAPALAQNYPPPAGCTQAERDRFHAHQHAETLAFNAQQRQERQLFHASGPHTPGEKRAFANAQHDERRAFQRQHQLERKQFQENCKAGIPPQLLRPRPSSTDLPASPVPVLRLWHVLLALGIVVAALLLRRRLRASVASR